MAGISAFVLLSQALYDKGALNHALMIICGLNDTLRLTKCWEKALSNSRVSAAWTKLSKFATMGMTATNLSAFIKTIGGNLALERSSDLSLRDRRMMDMHPEQGPPRLTPCIPPLTLVLADLTFIKDCRLAWKILRMDQGEEDGKEAKEEAGREDEREDCKESLSDLARDARTRQFLDNYIIPFHDFAQRALQNGPRGQQQQKAETASRHVELILVDECRFPTVVCLMVSRYLGLREMSELEMLCQLDHWFSSVEAFMETMTDVALFELSTAIQPSKRRARQTA